ncbi:MAG: hypothetical protein HYW62_04510 [Candidatus Levybacteria bacterium]|nr:hypothetical protein [Candidatus Levybacteria bacterium]
MEEVKSEQSWNKKRIFAAVLLLTLLAVGGYFFKTRVLGTNSSFSNPFRSVKSASSEQNNGNGGNLNVGLQKVVKDQLDNLKQEVSKLNIAEVASSSPQVQKIINDIKSLEQYPTNQVKEICRQICGL